MQHVNVFFFTSHEMQIFHLKQCNEVKDGRVNITFHAARDAGEVF